MKIIVNYKNGTFDNYPIVEKYSFADRILILFDEHLREAAVINFNHVNSFRIIDKSFVLLKTEDTE